jgi:hypothetical protein
MQTLTEVVTGRSILEERFARLDALLKVNIACGQMDAHLAELLGERA